MVVMIICNSVGALKEKQQGGIVNQQLWISDLVGYLTFALLGYCNVLKQLFLR